MKVYCEIVFKIVERICCSKVCRNLTFGNFFIFLYIENLFENINYKKLKDIILVIVVCKYFKLI